MRFRTVLLLVVLGLLLVAAATFRILITRGLDGGLSFSFPEEQYLIYRLVPLVSALIVGSALGVSGMGLQVLLRNPLASPWILGLSSGAGLGVMAIMFAEHSTGMTFVGGQTIGAVVGAIMSLVLVYALSRRRGGIDPMSMVLVGVVISVLCGSGIMIFQHLVPMGLRGSFTTWLMGSLPEIESWQRLGILGALVLGCTWLVAWWGPTLDAVCLSDDEATSVGVNLPSIRLRLFLVSSVLAAIGVILAGPIAFVGLIAPHGARLMMRCSHRVLTIGTAILGALLLIAADDVRQLVDFGTGRLPIGIVTSIIGGLLFLVLLVRGRGRV
ncbi:MAG TPA: iron ABC transporter permease [Phycisphaerales bacterium]|jgi:iron complex transport system permease protein|nr:iron ABC transporter permease [Phycisphaerales bacterium]